MELINQFPSCNVYQRQHSCKTFISIYDKQMPEPLLLHELHGCLYGLIIKTIDDSGRHQFSDFHHCNNAILGHRLGNNSSSR